MNGMSNDSKNSYSKFAPVTTQIRLLIVVRPVQLAKGVERFIARLHRVGMYQDDRHDARFGATVDPVVDGAPLNHHITGLEVNLFASLQFHVDFARHHDDVIDGVRPVNPLLKAWTKVKDSKNGTVLNGGEFARPQAVVGLSGVV
jgi:hypothetical protein